MNDWLKSPYPYFGGKSTIAAKVWERLGDVRNFVDPFFGSGALLLKRPAEHPYLERTETVNDAEGMICNFWRAIQAEPETVADYAEWPVNENDLHARHSWLVGQKAGLVARLEGDPGFYDAQIAGWWVWGMALWIGGGFCSGDGPWQVVDGELVHLGNAGQGTQRRRVHLAASGQGVAAKQGGGLYEWFEVLAERLRRVRVCCGDWSRVVTNSVTGSHGLTGVVLDPPYTHANRATDIYNHDHPDIAAEVRAWAVENGNNPLLRIAYFGYVDGFQWPAGWTEMRWKGPSGFGVQRRDGENQNREREVVWFSPHCLKADTAPVQQSLFGKGVVE